MASRPRDIDSRIQALEAQLADDPASPAFFPLAGLTWEKGEADKAIDLLTSGLQHHTAYTAPRVLLGEIYLAKDQIGEAASELEKAIARAPWNLAAQRFLMDCHKKSGDEGGVRRAQVAIGMFDPGDSAAALDEGGDAPAPVSSASAPVQDEDSIDEALAEEAGDAVPTESLAELYVSQGHIEIALDVYQILAEEDPENTDYLEKISDLREQLDAGGGEAAPGIEGGAAELEDFDSILVEAEGVDDGAAEAPELEAPELEDFDSILDEAAADVEAPAARADGAEAGGEVDDLDALFADESDEPAAPAPAADEPEDLDALGEPPGEIAEEPEEVEAGAVLAAEAAQEEAGAVLAENMAAMEEPAPEPVLNEAENMMSGIIDMYINEGNAPLALDLCRKALTAGQGAAWLEAKIQELEARVAQGGEGDLPRPAGEVMEDAEPSYSGPHSDVVKSLESWLRTIQRRKERISPGPQGGPGGVAD
jgi:tetratricopeptide (TPR) repeat protein